MDELWQNIVLGLRPGSAIALVAIGVVVVYRGSGVLNFSQGAMGMVGAYAFYEVRQDETLGVIPSLIVGVLVGAVLGALCYILIIRWLRESSELIKVIATLGILVTLQGLAVIRYGVNVILVDPLFGDSGETVKVFGARMTIDTLVTLVIIVVLCLLASALFAWTTFGARATALRENPMAAAAVSISPHSIGLITWAGGGALAALAGVLLLPSTGLTPTTLTLLVIPALAAGLLGRFQAFGLTAIIALLIGVLQSELQLGAEIEPRYTQAIPFIVIVVSLMARGRTLPGRGSVEAVRLPIVDATKPRPLMTAILVAAAIFVAFTWKGALADALLTTSLVGLPRYPL